MVKGILKSLEESIFTILPLYIIVIILSIPLNFSIQTILMFSISALLLAIGISFFTFGTNISMIEIGNKIGNGLIKSKKLYYILISCFIIGVFLTIAEPDLKVLASQFTSIPNTLLIFTVGIGVGVYLLISSLRILYNLKLNTILIISYSIIFVLLLFVPQDFIPIAFDSGGVTTGPISSSFILTLGLGFAALRSDINAKNESFGFISLCSIGPIISVLILGLLFNTSSEYKLVLNELPLMERFIFQFKESLKEVTLSLIPIILLYLVYKNIFKNVSKIENRKILLGLFITLIGLTLFLTGANVGFINVGYTIGSKISSTNLKYLIIPIGMVMAFFIEMAEPTVKIITSQIEKVTEDSISKEIMQLFISLGVSLAVGVSLFRALLGINIYYFLVIGYLIAISLTFITPKIFTSIAFDCGGIVSGPLTATFLLPVCIGTCMSVNGNIMTDAFGLIALLAMTPPILIQLLGLLYKYKTDRYSADTLDDSIIDYGVNV